MKHRIHARRPQHAFATAGAGLYVFWKTGVSLQATASLFEVMDGLLEAHDAIAVLVTVYDGIELPQRDEQTSISEGLRVRAPNLRHGVAIAVEGSGVGATLGRSIARTISLFSRQGYPSQVFPAPAEGLTWLRSKGADAAMDAEIYRAIRADVDQLQA